MRLVTIAVALLLSAFTVFAADVSGAWTMTLDSPQGAAEATLTLKQEGGKVTGTYKGPRNTATVAGTMAGNDLKLTAAMDAGGQSVALVFTAKVAADKMDGSINFAGQMDVPFKGSRKN